MWTCRMKAYPGTQPYGRNDQAIVELEVLRECGGGTHNVSVRISQDLCLTLTSLDQLPVQVTQFGVERIQTSSHLS